MDADIAHVDGPPKFGTILILEYCYPKKEILGNVLRARASPSRESPHRAFRPLPLHAAHLPFPPPHLTTARMGRMQDAAQKEESGAQRHSVP